MKLSLAGWSLHKLFRSPDAPLALVDFPRFARDNFLGLDAVELNNIFFASREPAYLQTLVAAAAQEGVKLLNIAVDEKGDLSGDDEVRAEGLANYLRWIPVAKEIGCGAIRANSGGKNLTDREQAVRNCTDSFRRLADEGLKHGVTILIENHWGLSGDADSLARVVEGVRETHGEAAIGSLPDFGNWPDDVDRYAALQRILPYAKAVHAKVLDIDEELNHPKFDLERCIQLARDADYDGYLGIEYEGLGDQVEGVRRAVRKLAPLL